MALIKGTSFFELLMLMVCNSVAIKMPYSCTKSGKIEMEAIDDAITFVSTVPDSPLRKGQTLCYDLIVEEGENVKSGRNAFISLLDVHQQHEVKSSYNFSVPTMDVRCECDCYGGFDSCYPDVEKKSCQRDYSDGSGSCEKKYSHGHGNRGCLLYGQSEVCCDISLYKKTFVPDYTAVYFGKPITIYTVETGFFDDQGELLGRSMKSELTSESLEINTTIGSVGAVGQPTETSMVEFKWYFMRYSDKILLTGEPINDLNERQLNKLGWYKFDSQGQLLPLDWSGIRRTLTTEVINCRTNYITWHSSASFYRRRNAKQESIGVKLEDFLKTEVNMTKDSRSVNVTVSSPQPIFIHATINAPAKLVFRYRMSVLKNFTAEIQRDRFGNQTLLLRFFGASGSVSGSVERVNTNPELFTILIASVKPIDKEKVIHLLSNHTCPSNVCLSSTEEYEVIQCVMVPCKDDDLVEDETTIPAETKVNQSKSEIFQHENVTPTESVLKLLNKTIIGVGVGVCGCLLLFLAVIILCYLKKKRCSSPFQKKKKDSMAMATCLPIHVSSNYYKNQTSAFCDPSSQDNSQCVEDHIYAEVEYTSVRECLLPKDRAATSSTPQQPIRDAKRQQHPCPTLNSKPGNEPSKEEEEEDPSGYLVPNESPVRRHISLQERETSLSQ